MLPVAQSLRTMRDQCSVIYSVNTSVQVQISQYYGSYILMSSWPATLFGYQAWRCFVRLLHWLRHGLLQQDLGKCQPRHWPRSTLATSLSAMLGLVVHNLLESQVNSLQAPYIYLSGSPTPKLRSCLRSGSQEVSRCLHCRCLLVYRLLG